MMQQTNENEIHSELLGLQFVIPQTRKVVQYCTWCEKKMELVEGDVIYGKDWYHAICWKLKYSGGKQNV